MNAYIVSTTPPGLIVYNVHIVGEEHSGMQSAQDLTVDEKWTNGGVHSADSTSVIPSLSEFNKIRPTKHLKINLINLLIKYKYANAAFLTCKTETCVPPFKTIFIH